MGSYSSLDIDRFVVHWGANYAYGGHSALFLPTDATDVVGEDADEEDAPFVAFDQEYRRCLRCMKRRLGL